MLKVKSRTGESVQQMMRRFKKLCEKEGLIRDMKRNAYTRSPLSVNRRRIRKAQRILLPFTPRPDHKLSFYSHPSTCYAAQGRHSTPLKELEFCINLRQAEYPVARIGEPYRFAFFITGYLSAIIF